VVKLGLCPYAAQPFSEETIRYHTTEATTEAALFEEFMTEGLLLLDSPELSTTMLIAPRYTGDCADFYAFYERLTEMLEDESEELLSNRIQPAFFHPQWTFDGLDAEDAVHFEKRAPLPVINLLRRSQLDDAVRAGLERGEVVNQQIAEHNEAALRRAGSAALRRLFVELAAPPVGSPAGEVYARSDA
jgi:hypothetical protein